jgi:hypothetical protein
MEVIGGRQWWQRASSGAAVGGVAVLVYVSGCGGRTSMFDAAAYDQGVDADADDASAGNGSKGGAAGRSATGTAGNPAPRGGTRATGGGAGTAGTISGGGSTNGNGGGGGGGGGDDDEVSSLCGQYCSGYDSACGNWLPGQVCSSSCEAQLNGVKPACKELGKQALLCLSLIFRPGLDSCEGGLAVGRQACGKQLDLFQSCNDTHLAGPLPIRALGAMNGDCNGLVADNEVSCQATFSCPPVNYTVYCGVGAPSHLADCSCLGPRGVTHEGTFQEQGQPCAEAVRLFCY